MELRIPHWAHQHPDEGIMCFIAFAMRVGERYGFNTWYTIHKEDLAIIVNKRPAGLVDWIRNQDVGPIELGDLLEHTCMFKMPDPSAKGRRIKTHNTHHLVDDRQRLVWVYLIGCLNHNLMAEEPQTGNTYRNNSKHVTEFKITREAYKYLKIKERH